MEKFYYSYYSKFNYLIILCFILIMSGCSVKERKETTAESYISEANIFLNSEIDDFVGWPVQINVTSDCNI